MFIRKFLISSMLCLVGQVHAMPTEQPLCELNIFIHGTYGSAFSFLSYPWVRNDALKGTTYEAVQRKMRDSQFAQYRRLMGDSGLTEVGLATDLDQQHPIRYVVDAFRSIHHTVHANDFNEHRYFMFGWNGLLSQQERRQEAIRLYNELVALVEQVKVAGKTPVLNVYAHSHGCNVLLNLALIDACVFDMASLPPFTESDVVSAMQKLFIDNETSLSSRPVRRSIGVVGTPIRDLPLGAHWYQKPITRLQVPLNATLLAIPVQPETAPLVASSIFSKVLHLYSENDGIIISDFISSKKKSQVFFDEKITQGHPTVKTIRWMNGRTPLDECPACLIQQKKSRLGMLKNLSKKRFDKIKNGGGNPDCHHPMDPTHADFWATGNKREGAFFEEVPLVVYMPLVEALVGEAGDAQRLDFCLLDKEDGIAGALFVHDHEHKPTLVAMQEVSNVPIIEARHGIRAALNVTTKIRINVKLTLPSFLRGK